MGYILQRGENYALLAPTDHSQIPQILSGARNMVTNKLLCL